jgi:hypothetical protein
MLIIEIEKDLAAKYWSNQVFSAQSFRYINMGWAFLLLMKRCFFKRCITCHAWLSAIS